MDEVLKKLTAARTQLILERPFLGALVLRLPLIEATGTWCTSSATDARSIYYSPAYMAPLTLSQVQFVLAHEALHCGLAHFARREHRDIERWNIACDHAVNPLLVEEGLALPPDALYNEEYAGLSAEEIYPLIKSDSSEQTLDQHLYDRLDDGSDNSNLDQNNTTDTDHSHSDSPPRQSQQPPLAQNSPQSQNSPQPDDPKPHQQQSSPHASPEPPQQSGQSGNDSTSKSAASTSDYESDSGESLPGPQPGSDNSESHSADQPPPPLSAQEKSDLNIRWQQRLVGAAQQASQAGKMNGSVARIIDRLLRSTIPWRTLLARFMGSTARVDYNMMRPSQRRSGEAILPSLHTRQTRAVIAIDTSGSIDPDELNAFVTEVNAIKSLVNAQIILLACDRQLDPDAPWIFEPWENLVLPGTLQGGGGTDFRPVFSWVAEHAVQADLVVYFTDAQGRFPDRPASVETLWLVKGAAPVPWGQRIQLN